MADDRTRAVLFGVAVHLARFGAITGALAAAAAIGVPGWYLGLTANVACVAFAAALVTWRRLWRTSGILVAWRGRTALLLLVPLLLEVLAWTTGGLEDRAPGFGLWALTLLLVGVNEELISRVVVLERLRSSFAAPAAVTITAALFGLQHFSAFATTTRTADDIALNVLVSACYGFALAAFQYRYRWVLPLILLHAAADFTTILSLRPLTDPAIAATLVVFLGLGVVTLRSGRGRKDPGIAAAETTGPRRPAPS
ncbi:CPBP family intramembrane glutamic endopeptidase [Rathayibacter sp. Leaf296]|uniref:CPBP family intramembrane glutamic endopeptidase n=1 Tax=Rathayibacter sp. Leaf296 TaxID=1736327 RepID=UPI000A58C89A|nr:CPBP family intramembrane glutamic endopeptidase [Rathayibacter sp. Leaf296]